MKTLLFVLLLLPNFSFCQNLNIEFAVKYKNSSYRNELIIGDSITLWKDMPSEESTNVLDKAFFVKNHFNKTIYLSDFIFNKTFYVKDSLNNMKWELTNGTKIVLNQKCNAAITHFRGRKYIVYYAVNLPYSNGPWKFGGLPGLILEVKSDDDLYQFVAVKIIKNYTTSFKPANITNYKFISWDDFVSKFIITVDNTVKMVRTNADSDSKGYVKIDAPEIIYPKAQEGTGIEY
ncbi:GLPGLI family protein [Arcicella sp. DC2W]|uniref:GLPGLI family protein n=1 Tax=Arcicella gelida TaxID=2984195 RepID=A0ABU5SAI3_9BACT|nr:GLPGLI family protein [Arcicella sp. DC2W]MEA5405470.1 GLPGLI family protein [Arcicella sp. DC2W]